MRSPPLPWRVRPRTPPWLTHLVRSLVLNSRKNDVRWVTVPKIATDQLFWGPFWNAVYILFLGVLKKDSVATIWEAITSTAVPLVVAGLRLWPLAHVITYGL